MPESDTRSAKDLFTKDVLIAAPVLISAVAISFDVGYFLGLDLNYFTLFSLSEHILFAFEALPLAFVLFGMFIPWYAPLFAPRETGVASDDPTINLVASEQKSLWSRIVNWIHSKYVLEIGTVLFALVSEYFFEGRGTVVSIVLLAILLIRRSAIWFVANPVVAASYAAICLMVLVNAVGYDIAKTYVKGDTPLESASIDNVERHGRLIRAGERGILFYDTGTHDVSFFKWDAVKWIRKFR
jgi:hypothetical protein